MKKRLSIAFMLLLIMQLPVVAQRDSLLIISVQDGQGNALEGAQVTLKDAYGELIGQYITDASGTHEVQALPSGMYVVQVVDPANGYTDTKRFNCFETMQVDLVIRALEPGSELTVGTLTQPTGGFFTDMWGNNTTDIDVRALLHGYATVAWTDYAGYEPDLTVLTSIQSVEDDADNKTYTMEFARDLTYNDGTPITARDYAFSVLLQSAPQCVELGAMAYTYNALMGFDAFNEGESSVFSGVRVVDDYTLSLTINATHLPYFYELTYVNVVPYPIHVIAPGMRVADDGAGAYLTPLLDDEGNPLGAFTAEVLRATILDPETGYQTNSTVTNGPYQLTGYNRAAATVYFSANRRYRGNYERRKPTVDKLTLKQVSSATMLDELAAEAVDVINKVGERSIIDDAC